jgi:hypothetical protein
MTKLKRTANVSGNRPPIATRRQMGGRRVRQFPIRRKPAA